MIINIQGDLADINAMSKDDVTRWAVLASSIVVLKTCMYALKLYQSSPIVILTYREFNSDWTSTGVLVVMGTEQTDVRTTSVI